MTVLVILGNWHGMYTDYRAIVDAISKVDAAKPGEIRSTNFTRKASVSYPLFSRMVYAALS